MEELKIIEPIKEGLNNFKTIDEFSIYYAKHKKEMIAMTTQKLNKQFKIEGYRITKIGTRDKDGKRQSGEICLKKIHKLDKINDETYEPTNYKTSNEQLNTLTQSVNSINERLNALTQTVNSIISALNEG